MFCEKIKRLCFIYKAEDNPQGVSINTFCTTNNIPHTTFYDWFKNTQKKIIPVEVEGIPKVGQAVNER